MVLVLSGLLPNEACGRYTVLGTIYVVFKERDPLLIRRRPKSSQPVEHFRQSQGTLCGVNSLCGAQGRDFEQACLAASDLNLV